ncbi:MAG: histidine kinase [Bacteroidetes bacterium]|nr:histidine kinase [Bacteroidota bacterium]
MSNRAARLPIDKKMHSAWLITALGLPVTAVLYTAFSWDYFGMYENWNVTAVPLYSLIAFAHYAYFLAYAIPSLKRQNYTLFSLHVLGSMLVLMGILHLVHTQLITKEEMNRALEILYQDKASAILKNSNFIGFIHAFSAFLTSLFIVTFNGILANWQFNALGRSPAPATSFLDTLPPLQTLRTVVWHLAGWAFWIFITVFNQLMRGEPIAWDSTLLMTIPSVLFFYISLRTSFKLLTRDQLLLAIVSALVLWFLLCLLKSLWFIALVKGLGFPPILDGVDVIKKTSAIGPVNSSGFYSTGKIVGYVFATLGAKEAYIILISFIYGYARRAIRYQRELNLLAEMRQKEALHQQELQRQVVDARLQSLKYQINPHFLFNSLNFLYAQALPLSERLSRSTLLLSEMMRYALNENSDEARVPLEQEVQHLENFLEFNQLRFSNRLQVNFTTEGNLRIRRIMPLLLITFVENAFKYGELHDMQHPLCIRLQVTADQLSFFVKNKKRGGPKENSTGIGLDNIRRRLLLGYPDRHTLNITEDDQFFTTELILVL